ncbi:MAG: GspH/FimT family pseudopilin, partial [Acidobacteriota bacterium]
PISSSADLPVQVQNKGTEILQVTSITSNNTAFTVFPTSLTLAPGASTTVTVTFTPTGTGTHNGTLTFASNDPDEPSIAIAMTGAGS